MSQHKRQFLDWVCAQDQEPDLARMSEEQQEQYLNSLEPTVKGNRIYRKEKNYAKRIRPEIK